MENIAATLPAHRMAHALEGTMATTMASRDCEGQSEPIKEGDVGRKKKKKIKSNCASCHFSSCFAKNVCLTSFVFYFPLSEWYASLCGLWMTVGVGFVE